MDLYKIQLLKSAERDIRKIDKQEVGRILSSIRDMRDFGQMNDVYESALQGHKPARSTVEVAKLPLGAMVEIECIASLTG